MLAPEQVVCGTAVFSWEFAYTYQLQEHAEPGTPTPQGLLSGQLTAQS